MLGDTTTAPRPLTPPVVQSRLQSIDPPGRPRGLWLVVLEMTVILFATTFNFSYEYIIWQVIWVIGWSMVALSVLIFVERRTLLVASVVVIAGTTCPIT